MQSLDLSPKLATRRGFALLAAVAIAATSATARAADAAASDAGRIAAAPALAASETANRLPDLGERPARFENSFARRSYAIPAAEIVGFEVLLNLANRNDESGDYKSNLSTIRRNLKSSWRTDRDPFLTNQLGHPYAGSMYHTFARSAGLDFWESMGYAFAGSALWEIAGERTPPSRNDQINTGIGGAFLGEGLYRLANLMLEEGGERPSLWREIGAAAISPATAFNRYAFPDRFGAIISSRNPAYYSRLQLGVSGTASSRQGSSTKSLKRNEALADYSIDYGLPGKPGYSYDRPFDYFNLQATVSSANGFENLTTRGLLIGKTYEAGSNYRGVFGLYSSYDYLAPQLFRVSSTAVSLGTTGELRLTDAVALQGTGLIGVGYAAVGTARPNASDVEYHYGVAPQALLALRAIFAERASLDLTAREYFVSRIASANQNGRDNIVRLEASLTWRISGRHAVSLKYLGNRRDANFVNQGDVTQSRGTIGIFYTYLGQDGFGRADWR